MDAHRYCVDPGRPRDMEFRHRTKRGADSRNRIRRKPLHRILEDLLPGPFRLRPSRPLQRPVSRRSAFHRTESTNAPPGGQRRSPGQTSSCVRTLPDRPRQWPMMFEGGIRLAIHSSDPPINPTSWLAASPPGAACTAARQAIGSARETWLRPDRHHAGRRRRSLVWNDCSRPSYCAVHKIR
jgi:hypothetical protein